MTDDVAERLAARTRQDDRKFLIKALDPERAPRLAPALRAVRGALIEAGESGISHADALMAMLDASDVLVKTANQMLWRLKGAGFIRREGVYRQDYNRKTKVRTVSDFRRYFLIEWPEESER